MPPKKKPEEKPPKQIKFRPQPSERITPPAAGPGPSVRPAANTMTIKPQMVKTSPVSSNDPSSEALLDVIEIDEAVPRKSEPSVVKRSRFLLDLIAYCREFTATIEIDGIRYLFEEGRSYFERLFWLVVIIISLALFIFLTLIVVDIYQHTPIIVSFSTKDAPIYDIPFPAITICSQTKTDSNNFNFAKIHKSYESRSNFSNQEFKHYQYFFMVCDNPLHRWKNPAHYNQFADKVSDNFFDTIQEYSPPLDEVITRCSYLNRIENCSQIFKPIITRIGLCYSFNLVEYKETFCETISHQKGFFEAEAPGTDWESLNATMTTDKLQTYPRRGFLSGATNALTIHLAQNKRNVDSVCTSGISGFKVSIHDPLQIPNFDEYYHHISLDTTVIALIDPILLTVSDLVKALSPEIRECYVKGEKVLKLYRRYNQANCLSECFTNFTLKLCGCLPFYKPRIDVETPICGAAKVRCMHQAKNQFEISSLEKQINESEHLTLCDCKPYCSELRYDTEISVAQWNWHNYYNVTDNETGMSHFSVFFKNDHYLNQNKLEFQGIADLMAKIGGLLNFFVGSSVLTFAEIIYAFTLKILFNKLIYGPWAGPAAVQYRFDN